MKIAITRKQQLKLSCGFPREIINKNAIVFANLLFTSTFIASRLKRIKQQTTKR
jgi:hypothetical protein